MKSKTRATPMIDPTSRRVASMDSVSAVLDYDVLQGVGDVLAIVGGLFQQIVEFFQLDQANAVLFVAKQLAHRVAADLIGHFLQAVHFDALRKQRLVMAQRGEG